MGEYVNSKQARFDKSFVSCSIMEVHHLPEQSAAKTCFAIANALYHKANPRPAAFVLFSDVVKGGNESRGELLSRQFSKGQFGKFHESSALVNPRSGNTVKVWLLEIDHEKFREYYKEELANRVED